MKLTIAGLVALATTVPSCAMGSIILPPRTLTVFVTESSFKGNKFGGLAGADVICNEEAQAAGLPGDYIAWISDSRTSARDRIDRFDGAFALVDGTIVANTFDDLVDGEIDHLIDLQADGSKYSGEDCVWTGTNEDGSGEVPNYIHCSDWSQDWGLGLAGSTTSQNKLRDWTYQYRRGCGRNNCHLYCIQQPYVPLVTRIGSPDGDRCIDVPRRNMVNGQDLIVWECHGQENQMWKMDAQGRIRSKQNPKYCLDPQGPDTADNTPVQIWECEDNYMPQQWMFTAENEIRSLWTPDKCIDVLQNGDDSGDRVVMYHCSPQWNV